MKNQNSAAHLFKALQICTFTFLLLWFCNTSYAAAKTWTGNTSTAWATATNWSGNTLPGTSDDVTIPVRPRMPLITTGTLQVRSITINSGASLTMSGGVLSVIGASVQTTGIFTQTGGTIYADHDFVIKSGGNFGQSGTGILRLAKDINTNPTGSLNIATGATVNQAAGTIYVKDYTASPGTFNQSGATALFKLFEDWKPGSSSVFNSTGGTVEFAGNSKSADFVSGTTRQFYNILIDAGVNPGFDNVTKTWWWFAGAGIYISGNYTNNNTALNVSPGASFIFNGSGNQNIYSAVTSTSNATFGNLYINKPSGSALLTSNANVSGMIDIRFGTFDLSTYTCNNVYSFGFLYIEASGIMRLAGNTGGQNGSNFPTGVFFIWILPKSIVEYYGTAQTIFTTTYGNLVVSAAGTKTAVGNLNIRNSFTLSTATFVGGSYNHNVGENWTMTSGVFTNTGNTITFNGTGQQNIASTGAFNKITINKAAGATAITTDVTANTLNFVKGIVKTSANKMIIAQGGTVTGAAQTTGWVNGNLQKYHAAVAGATYEIGSALNYSPLSISFAALTTPGNLIACATATPHPNVSTSTIKSKNISRYWTLTKPASGAVGYTTATISFNWNTVDNYTPINAAALRVANYSNSVWSYPLNSGTPTTTSITCTGVANTGGFAVGEIVVCTGISSFSYGGSEFCTNGGNANVVLNSGASSGTFTATPAGLNIKSNNGQIKLNASTPGTYTVTNTVTASGCTSATNATIAITAAPSATINYPAATYCATGTSTATVNLTGTTGGDFSSTYGLIIDVNTGDVDVANSDPGTYTVTYTLDPVGGCPASTTTTTITIVNANYANIEYPQSAYCLNGGIASVGFDGTPGGTFSSASGLSLNSTTGDITLATCTPGTYTVKYSGSATNGCAAFADSTTINILASCPATISYSGSPYCSSAGIASVTLTGQSGGTFSSTTGLVIDNFTGDIDLAASTAGTYTVNYSLGGCSTNAMVTINTDPSGTTVAYAGAPFCTTVTSAQTATVTGSTGGVFSSAAGLSLNTSTGAITPSTSTPGTYTVKYDIAVGGCAAYSTTTPLTITASPIGTTVSYPGSPFCTSLSVAQNALINGVAGGTFTAFGGLTITSAGAITPSTSTPGSYTIAFSMPAAGGCAAFFTSTSATITLAPSATISYAGAPFCTSVTTARTVTRTGTAGGTFSSTPGLSINAASGAILPSASTAGTYTVNYTIPGSNGCAAYTATTTITITATPSASISYPGTPYCNTTNLASVTRTGTPGGTYSSTAGLSINAATGDINPSASTPAQYTVTYTIAAAGGCAGYTKTTTVIITAPPPASISYANSPYCSNAGIAAVTHTGAIGGTYSSTTGLTIDAQTGDIDLGTSTPGTYTVTYSIFPTGCSLYTTTTTVTIFAGPAATITYAGSPYCNKSDIATITQTGTTGGTYSSTVGLSLDSVTGTVVIGTSTPGFYTVTYTVPASSKCAVYTATTTISVNTNIVWTGNVSRDWFDLNNWTCSGIPDITSDALIPGGLTNYPVIAAALGFGAVKNLTIQAGASITVFDQLEIAGTVDNAGLIYADSGRVSFYGSVPQIIPAGLFANNIIKDLEISNPVSVSLNGQLRITGSLAFGNVNNTVFTTGDSLTLASVSTTDAQVKDITNNGVNSGNVISGLVTVERYMPPKRAYRFLTAPVNSSGSIRANWMENSLNPTTYSWLNPNPGYGTNITGTGDNANGFDPTQTHNPSMFTFNSQLQAWVPIPNTNGLMSVGNAYRIIIRGDRTTNMNSNTATPTSTTLRATGTLALNNVTYTKSGAGGPSGLATLSPLSPAYNLVANPYASAINWLTVSKTDIGGTIWIFDPNVPGANNRGGYVTYNCIMGTSNIPSSAADYYIQSGQSFFVQTSGPNPTITFKETDKSSMHRSVFRTTNTDPTLSVQLLLPSQDGTPDATDGFKVFFDDAYNNAVGPEDSYKLSNQDENIAILRGKSVLSIEGRSPVIVSDTIPIKIWQLTQSNYILKLNFANFADNVEAYLEDKYLHLSSPLTIQGETKVPVNITSDPASSATDRYRIVFEAYATLPLHLLGVKAVEKNNGIDVSWTAESESNMDRYEVEKSADGQQFLIAGTVKAKVNPGSSSNYDWFDLLPFDGDNYYRIKSVDKAGETKYSSVVKVKITKGISGITVFPNPARGKTITLRFNNIKEGDYAVSIVNSAGTTLYEGSILHERGSSDHSIQLNQTIPSGVYQLLISNGNDLERISLLMQ